MVVEPGSGRIRWRMSAPVKDPRDGELLGVVVVGIDPASLSAVTTGKRILSEGADTQSFRIGDTGETYIVNQNGLLLTESRFVPGAVFKIKVESKPVRAAIERGEEIMDEYTDYRGVEVSGSSAILRDMGWVLLTEIDFRQAFAPITRLHDVLVWLAVAAAFAAVFFSG